MTKSVSITVHPSGLSGEYLTVSDAMHQVLDMIGALEGIESGERGERQIVWRLTDPKRFDERLGKLVKHKPVEKSKP